MGIGDGDSVVSMVFGEGTSHHGLIGGGTVAANRPLLHTLIMSSMMNYSPEQLNLYLMDFKGGTEFKIYESERLPHIKLLALDALQEFGESILEKSGPGDGESLGYIQEIRWIYKAGRLCYQYRK